MLQLGQAGQLVQTRVGDATLLDQQLPQARQVAQLTSGARRRSLRSRRRSSPFGLGGRIPLVGRRPLRPVCSPERLRGRLACTAGQDAKCGAEHREDADFAASSPNVLRPSRRRLRRVCTIMAIIRPCPSVHWLGLPQRPPLLFILTFATAALVDNAESNRWRRLKRSNVSIVSAPTVQIASRMPDGIANSQDI